MFRSSNYEAPINSQLTFCLKLAKRYSGTCVVKLSTIQLFSRYKVRNFTVTGQRNDTYCFQLKL